MLEEELYPNFDSDSGDDEFARGSDQRWGGGPALAQAAPAQAGPAAAAAVDIAPEGNDADGELSSDSDAADVDSENEEARGPQKKARRSQASVREFANYYLYFRDRPPVKGGRSGDPFPLQFDSLLCHGALTQEFVVDQYVKVGLFCFSQLSKSDLFFSYICSQIESQRLSYLESSNFQAMYRSETRQGLTDVMRNDLQQPQELAGQQAQGGQQAQQPRDGQPQPPQGGQPPVHRPGKQQGGGDVDFSNVGRRVLLPSSFIGGPRQMRQLYQVRMLMSVLEHEVHPKNSTFQK